MTEQKDPYDWHGFVVHFIFFGVIGAGLVFLLWIRSYDQEPDDYESDPYPLLIIFTLGGGTATGLAAGLAKDKNWDKFWEEYLYFNVRDGSQFDDNWAIIKVLAAVLVVAYFVYLILYGSW